LTLACAAVFVRGLHPFLSVSAPVASSVLVVEGWVSDYAVEAAAQEFSRGGYSVLYVTGGPMERGAPLSDYTSYASLGAAVAEHFGVPTRQVQAVSAPSVRRDRTYASALALHDWMEIHNLRPPSLNVVTVGPHARRTRLLYEEAFGEGCRIGVISVEPEDYDPGRWWAYSQGVRSVMSETAAYLYVRIFFRVGAERRAENKSGEDSGESSP
jgi:hypothetical protein